MKQSLIVLVMLVGASAIAQKQPKHSGPPGYTLGQNPKQERRGEPEWSHSKLEITRTDFSKARAQFEAEHGPLFGEVRMGDSKAKASLAAFGKTKNKLDAFKALLYYSASGVSQTPVVFDQLWDQLPKDEYEVARLHFIWKSGDAMCILTPLGDRLLGKNPKDIGVLHVMAFLRSFFRPEMDLTRAESYATIVLKAKPCASSYLRYGMVKMFVAKAGGKKADGLEAHKYIDKYFASASPQDTWRKSLATGWMKWLKDNGY